jgi:GNAT superfamily N-acetyltransferase
MATVDLALVHYDRESAAAVVDELVDVYAEVYADRLGDPFYATERFVERLATYRARPGYALVTGRFGGDLLGYAFGVALPADSLWWRGLRCPVPEETTRETGDRTFAVNELMVRVPWRRRGVARQLHDALLGRRPEERATLLVDPANTPARTAYLSWGWSVVGPLQPFPDAPVYDAMVLDLGGGRDPGAPPVPRAG